MTILLLIIIVLKSQVKMHCTSRLMVFVVLCWCSYMVIDVNVQYNGGFLPGIIILTLCDQHWGTYLIPS